MKKRSNTAHVDWGTPLNEYLCTEYLYHNRCATRGCDYVRHELPGVCSDDLCPKCGGCCWHNGMGSTPERSEPWYVQYLDPTCLTCRKTLARLTGITAQRGLFEEVTP